MSKRTHSQVSESSSSPKLLSNLEVLEILSSSRKQKQSSFEGKERKKQQILRHHDWIEEEVIKYIAATPCTALQNVTQQRQLQSVLSGEAISTPANKRQKKKKRASSADNTVSSFRLTAAESLQIVNSMPTDPVEIHLLIDELQSRMTERQQDELLVTIGSYRKNKKKSATAKKGRRKGASQRKEEDTFAAEI